MLLKNKRIFMIEDNLNNRAITQMLLEQQGARTAFERWGTDVIDKLEKFMPIDLILLDLMFPGGVSGYDIFLDIRRHEEFQHIPIAAVSAADPGMAISKTQELGFNGYISKPINFMTFPKQILSLINGESFWDVHD
jgi:two-component system, chemotaxis family, sensor kinase CheA